MAVNDECVRLLQLFPPAGAVQGGPEEWRVLGAGVGQDETTTAGGVQQVCESLRGPHAGGTGATHGARLELQQLLHAPGETA